MTGIFCELISIKKAQTALQNKETTVQSYWKMSDQNTKKIPGIEVAFFNRTGEIMDNFDYLNSSQYFYFVRNPRKKKLWLTYAYSWTFPTLPYMSQYVFSSTTPPLSKPIHMSEKSLDKPMNCKPQKSLYHQRQCNHKYPYKNLY